MLSVLSVLARPIHKALSRVRENLCLLDFHMEVTEVSRDAQFIHQASVRSDPSSVADLRMAHSMLLQQ